MIPPIPKFYPGQRLTTGDLNEMASSINSVRQPRGDETISVNQMGGGVAVRDERPPLTPDQGATLKVLATAPSGYPALGGGLYYAKVYMQSPGLTIDQTATTLTMPTPAPDQAIVVYLNPGEVGKTGHIIAADINVAARQFGYTANGWPLYIGTAPDPFAGKYRITAVSSSFPEWTYTAQRVVSYNSSLTAEARWVTDGVNVTAKNRCEWTPAAYPYTHGVGVTVADNTGAVATTFGGSTPGDCIIRSIGVGSVVDVTTTKDQSGNTVYSFYAPNSAQAS